MISAKIIADSKNKFGNRITTMVVVMPRYILAEFNTHRMLSRNSASSRAIPFEKNLEMLKKNPFIPIAWMKDHKGMQGTEFFTKQEAEDLHLVDDHLEDLDDVIQQAVRNSKKGVTKQLVNRKLEYYMYHTVVVTATDWENFFALRCPRYVFKVTNSENDGDRLFRSTKDVLKILPALESYTTLNWLSHNEGQADIHMMAVAEAMWDAYNESIPKQLKGGEWHIPFGDNIDRTNDMFNNITKELDDSVAIKIATARCARVSYTVVGEENKPDNYEADIKLHDRLAASGHWSPFEHCAKAMDIEPIGLCEQHLIWSGNFKGFVQYRKTFNNENITK